MFDLFSQKKWELSPIERGDKKAIFVDGITVYTHVCVENMAEKRSRTYRSCTEVWMKLEVTICMTVVLLFFPPVF